MYRFLSFFPSFFACLPVCCLPVCLSEITDFKKKLTESTCNLSFIDSYWRGDSGWLHG